VNSPQRGDCGTAVIISVTAGCHPVNAARRAPVEHLSAGAAHPDALATLLQSFHPAAQVQVRGPPRAGQQLLQGHPVQPEERRPERPAVQPAHRVDGDRMAVTAVTVDERSRLRRQPGQVIAQAEVLQHPRRVRGQRDAGAYLAQVRGLLENLGGDALAPQQQGQGEPADPSSGNHDPVSRGGHRGFLQRR